MLFYLKVKLAELRITARDFFRLAHVNRFGRDYDPHEDISEYMNGTIPKHVVEYLKEIQKREGTCSPPHP